MPEPEASALSQESHEASAQTSNYEAERSDRELGAKILSQANFESRHQPIVDSSFKKARERGEKLPGKNNERRNYSYLSRIENLVDKHGNRLEKKLWNKSAGQLVVSPEDITDGYWRAQEQILRGNGQGHTLSDYEKRVLVEDIQKSQRESLRSWSDYLGSEDSPYPMWFKVYAWDGMSKMGVFDKEKQQFAKRDKHTVAPYPKLNPAVLAKVYGAISDFYNQPEQSRYGESPERDAELEALVESGNFNKLYSKILLSEKAAPKTPERTEDIHGQWIEYLPGEEEKLAEAAEGTSWCVADPGAGRNYLEHGGYGPGNPSHHHIDENKAKFILFHLRDPETNTLSGSACASIRLDPYGEVAEISGLNEGQALEDSLVPIVEEKVRSLPGGERFLEAFADKQQLIALDHKMQNGEDFTKEELEFLYEIKRPIKSLSAYSSVADDRIREMRPLYIKDALGRGINADYLANHNPTIVMDNIDTFISYGANLDNIINKMMRFPSFVVKNMDTLVSHGIDIDMEQVLARMDPNEILKYADIFASHGINVDIDKIIDQMDPWYAAEDLSTLISHGANINSIVKKLKPWPAGIVENLPTLLRYGADIDINQFTSQLSLKDRRRFADRLIGYVTDPSLIDELRSYIGK